MNPDLLASTALWGVLLGLVTPTVTAIAQRPAWSRRLRTVVALATSVAVGLLTAGANGQLGDLQITAATVSAVVVAAQVSYRQFWQESGITEKIEHATTPYAPPRSIGPRPPTSTRGRHALPEDPNRPRPGP